MSNRYPKSFPSSLMRRPRVGLIVALSALIICCAPFAYLLRPPSNAPINSVRQLAETYGVSDEQVLELAAALGVDSERLAEYGAGDFPYNYFHHHLEEIERQTGVVTKDDVLALVQGYEVKCELNPQNMVYLFYSDKLASQAFGRRALMLDFRFNSDFRLERLNQPDLYDSGLEWEKQTIKEKCLKQ